RVLAVLVAFIDFYAMPLRYLAINVGCFLVLLMFMAGVVLYRRASHSAAEKINTGLAQVLCVLFVAAPLGFWLSSGLWFPKEKLTVVKPGAPAHVVDPAYVLSFDERWVKYMDDERDVHI